ncbi:N-acetylmuramoyl-L-alanine amidase [Alkalisalibacterium limincola]|uniref:N-acetylmuramoyl-L-alanine amidase n=1 Tax=Alkalisalibacterium limincola TaxID=2699169 RepID=UPI003CCD6F02
MLPDLPPMPDAALDPLPYEALLERREAAAVDLVVIHCTETPDLAIARGFGERVLYPSGTGNSGHFYIDRDGSVHVYVRPEFVAHHVRGHNANSVGIELVNTGRYPHWLHSRHQAMDEPYTEAQIQALLRVLAHLQDTLPGLARIAGHEDLDTDTTAASDDPMLRVPRKRDPGPQFPWDRVLEATGLQRVP